MALYFHYYSIFGELRMKYRILTYIAVFFCCIFSLAFFFPEEATTIIISSFMALTMVFTMLYVAMKKRGDTQFLRKLIIAYLILSIISFIVAFVS